MDISGSLYLQEGTGVNLDLETGIGFAMIGVKQVGLVIVL